jgi:serine/threonine/tyrosine-interacting protein
MGEQSRGLPILVDHFVDPLRPSKASNTVLSSRYSRSTPGPPAIFVPVADHHAPSVELVPSFDMADLSQLSREDIAVITGNRKQSASEKYGQWKYEHRRQAQPVLDFLYVGPTLCVRDRDFLVNAGITMIIVARDSRMAARNMLSVDKAAEELRLPAHYVDVRDPHHLISEFDEIFRIINAHLLQFNQNSQQLGGGSHGKVLVTCETGNDRSATIAAAYIMALYGKDMVNSVQFVGYRRFCSAINEDMKQILKSWEGILRARYSVRKVLPPAGSESQVMRRKRSLDDAMHVDEEDSRSVPLDNHDLARFSGRQPFIPFKEGPVF